MKKSNIEYILILILMMGMKKKEKLNLEMYFQNIKLKEKILKQNLNLFK